MPVTYTKIASVTVTAAGGADKIEFTAIPATYDDLIIKLSSRTNTSSVVSNITLGINGSTTNITARRLFGSGTTTASDSAVSFDATTGALCTASTFSNSEWYFPNYKGSTNKSFSIDAVSENNATAAYQVIQAGLRSVTDAITSISLDDANNFVQHSSATLYGIKKD